MNSADISATAESIDANRIASRLLSNVSPYFRVCTIDECRYRLCGITVAPRMPIAMYSMSRLVTISRRGKNPHAMAPRSGRESQISTANEPAIATINPTTSAST